MRERFDLDVVDALSRDELAAVLVRVAARLAQPEPASNSVVDPVTALSTARDVAVVLRVPIARGYEMARTGARRSRHRLRGQSPAPSSSWRACSPLSSPSDPPTGLGRLSSSMTAAEPATRVGRRGSYPGALARSPGPSTALLRARGIGQKAPAGIPQYDIAQYYLQII